MDDEYVLVNKICKDCGTTHEVLIKCESLYEPKEELYQCWNCYSVAYERYIYDETDDEDMYPEED